MGNQFSEQNRILREVYDDVICLPRDEARKLRVILRYFVHDFFVPKLKSSDKLIKSMFQQFYITGSFYDSIHSDISSKFDLNCVFHLPIHKSDLNRTLLEGTHSGFALFGINKEFNQVIPNTDGCHEKYKVLKSFLAQQGAYFDVESVQNWMNVWVKRILYDTSYICVQKQWCNVSISEGTGSLSIKIHTADLELTLRVIPVFEIDDTFLVPKPLRNRLGTCSIYWRVAQPISEREILQRNPIAKKVIKIIKAVRDTHGLWQFSSYYIRTVVLHCINLHGKVWYEKHLFYWVNESIVLLIQYLKHYNIPFFHNQQCNILQDLDYVIIDKIRNRYTKFLQDAEQNPEHIRDHLGGGHTRIIKYPGKKFIDVDSDEELQGAQVVTKGAGYNCNIQ